VEPENADPPDADADAEDDEDDDADAAEEEEPPAAEEEEPPAIDVDIFEAATDGDVAAIDAAVRGGVHVDSRAETTNATPLVAAVAARRTAAAIRLLHHGANPNARANANSEDAKTNPSNANSNTNNASKTTVTAPEPGPLGDGALHWACHVGDELVAAALLSHGADVNAVGELDNTPLHVACANHHLGIARRLLARGADVRAVNNYGTTPAQARSLITPVPVRPRSRSERRSLRTFAVVSPPPPLGFDARPYDAFRLHLTSAHRLHPDIRRSRYGTNDPQSATKEAVRRCVADVERDGEVARSALRVALAREAFDAAEAEEEDARETVAAEEAKRRKEEEVKKKREAVDEAHRLAELEDARRELANANQVRSIHWSPYDPVGVVNADP
jgi:hypothetical protein